MTTEDRTRSGSIYQRLFCSFLLRAEAQTRVQVHGPKVVVAGGTGFIGTELVKKLRRQG